MTILEINNLSKQFGGIHAVDRLSISVEKGRITSIIGPNGSGKTTLMNLLTGMLKFDHGTIAINHVKLSSISAPELRDYGITRTFQDVKIFEQMTVVDNILLVLSERNVFGALFEKTKPVQLQRAEAVLKRIDLWEKRGALAASLSYGQRKLLEVARVLVMDADIVLLDEPFAGLFKQMVATVVEILQELRTQGKTIVLIEHNMDLIRTLSDHIFVMDEGKLLANGTPEQVLANRKVIEAYLGE